MRTRTKNDARALDAPSAASTAPDASTASEMQPAPDSSDTQETVPGGVVDFPIVGIGASAGGLAAFEAFFSGMPADAEPGMAFVLVQHLAPDHKSILTDLVQRYTRMQVFEVEDGITVEANCAYIIPPNRDMAFLNGSLHLMEPAAPRGHRLPIDSFFLSLAQDLRERAIGIILSGTGSDGTLGVRAIKGEGGMVMAQRPDSTEYDGMPRSAIATGLVDYELAPSDMPAQLMAYARHAFVEPAHAGAVVSSQSDNALKKVFILLRAQTGHDFSQYKPNTLNRRIARRMAVQQIGTMDDYVRFLQQTPAEANALFRDLLIGVTSFFRDPEAFRALEEQIVPALFAGKSPSAVLRVWSAGCSTGEEAYSLAILLQERLELLKQSNRIVVFATDIDSSAIATARAGLYPASIAADISSERLARFFTAEADGSAYRIHKSIRDLLVFSEQDVIKDPPFSKLDFISCRNLMIYMGGELQKKLMHLFHYALNASGTLFLGTSETIGEFGEYFTTLDRKSKIYQRTEDHRGARRAAIGRDIPHAAVGDAAAKRHPGNPAASGKLPLRELTESALLQQIAPAAALVNEHGDILYLHGRTRKYLEPTPGEAAVNNIIRMAREGLQQELMTVLHKAVKTRDIERCPGLRVKTNGDFTSVNLTVRPVPTPAGGAGSAGSSEAPLFLVILEEVSPFDVEQARLLALRAAGEAIGADAAAKTDAGKDADARVTTLMQELRAKDEYLLANNEELQTANEELKSSNEEMQSVNEELQSTNEELETTKEELQSVNEELSTVNNELQTKVSDLSRSNDDMNNLLAGTGVGTVFVDHQLRILRFTPTATRIINLIAGDVGRPVHHLVSNLRGYDSLSQDVQTVLDGLIPKEVEVQTVTGEWFMMHILPYRTVHNVIDGAVITFVDCTETKVVRLALKESESALRLAVVVRDAYDAIAVHDLDGNILAWNPAAARVYGWTEAEALAMNVRELIPEARREAELAKVRELSRAEVLEPYATQRLTKNGALLDVRMTATALLGDTGVMYAIATTERVKE
jgi:two-component system, chemotaxis family, CheB/CheR fusion protein